MPELLHFVHSSQGNLCVSYTNIVFWKAYEKHLGNDSPAIRFTALRSVFAAGLGGAGRLAIGGCRTVKSLRTTAPLFLNPVVAEILFIA